ncbi:MAG: hypothetical protein HYW63_01920 [Candidatus Levybacteria bacterium]|nr:hypothetical protein [Candidatus Levybacteria bacterium]
MKKINNKKNYIFFILIIIFIIVFFLFFINFITKTDFFPIGPQGSYKLEEDYSQLKDIELGISTENDVQKINGKPYKVVKESGKTYFYYATPLEEVKNKVIFKNNRAIFAQEHIFENYRGYPWYVYLDDGVMIQSTNDLITGLVYFLPQDRKSFFDRIAPELNLSEDNLENTGSPEYGSVDNLVTPEPE